MIIAFTGHRPQRLLHAGIDLRPQAARTIRNYLVDKVRFCQETGEELEVISGMADGIDMIAFREAMDLYLPVTAAIPWVGHAANITGQRRKDYYECLAYAKDIVLTSDVTTYNVSVFTIRNRWMVDRMTRLASYWDGEPDGGTYDAICYAGCVEKPIDHLWMGDQSSSPSNIDSQSSSD